MTDLEQIQLRKEEVAQWMQYAQNDFDVAEYLWHGDYHPKPLEIICYHCSQAVEKGIKALIVDLGKQGGLPQRHDMEFLLNQIKNILPKERGITISDELLDWAGQLSDFSVNMRYPNQMQIDANITKWAIEKMERMMDWVKNALSD